MALSSPSSTRVWVLLAFCAGLVQAQIQAITPENSVNATIYPGDSKWSYHGCNNETVNVNGTEGARALSGGTTTALDTMTVQVCLDHCASGNYDFAGVEYTRECYCASYLSALSAKVPDTACNLACTGNTTQYCGGYLALSVYQTKKTTKSAGPKGESPVGSILALGVALAVLLCLA